MLDIDTDIYYHYSVFAPNANVEPSPQIISKLVTVFGDKNMIPTTVQITELGPTLKTKLQLQMITNDSSLVLAFEPNRFLLSRNNSNGVNIGSITEFKLEAEDIFARLFEVIPFSGTRLALATKGLMREMDHELLVAIHSKLLNLPSFYSENKPEEWTTRNVSRIDIDVNGLAEKTNVIMNIGRIQGSLQVGSETKQIDRVELAFDINTYQGNTNQRFGLEHAKSFLQQSIDLRDKLLKELGDIIDA